VVSSHTVRDEGDSVKRFQELPSRGSTEHAANRSSNKRELRPLRTAFRVRLLIAPTDFLASLPRYRMVHLGAKQIGGCSFTLAPSADRLAWIQEPPDAADHFTPKSGPAIKAVVLTDIHQMSMLPFWVGVPLAMEFKYVRGSLHLWISA